MTNSNKTVRMSMRNSKLIEGKKERDILRLKKLTPEQRLKAQAKLNASIKELFFAGLSSQGFSREEIIRLWMQRRSSGSRIKNWTWGT